MMNSLRNGVVGACLLAMPIGLCSSLLASGWLTVGIWLEQARPGVVAPPVRIARASAETTLRDVSSAHVLQRWRSEAEAALTVSVPVTLPYRETQFAGGASSFDDDLAAGVVSFQVDLISGDVLALQTEHSPEAVGGLLIEVFGPDLTRSTGARLDHSALLAALAPGDSNLRLIVEETGIHQIRVQQTVGSVGRFALAMNAVKAFDFPVQTDASNAVRSFFGMPRDGGRRQHHGIDIFARRGTPVLAATDGMVVRTGESERGGLHVWQLSVDDLGKRLGNLYYAHLDRVDVTAGMRVSRGQQLGTVGNTGNAVTTPPHLHFGFYRRFLGPVDPLPFTGKQRVAIPMLNPEPATGRWQRVRVAQANLREGPGIAWPAQRQIDDTNLVRVSAVHNDTGWLRVQTAPGVHGWLSPDLIAPAVTPITRQFRTVTTERELTDALQLRASPQSDSPVLGTYDDAQALRVLGHFGSASQVESKNGVRGWVTRTPEL